MATKKSEARGLQRAPRRDRTELREAPLVEELKHRLAANVRRLRLAKGWSQEAAADAADVSIRSYQTLEAGKTNATLVTVAALAKALGVDPSELLAASDSDG